MTIWKFSWFHGSSFKGFSIVFPAPWLAKVESSQKSNGMWFFRHFFAPFLFHRSRNNGLDKLRSKFWREKMFRKPHLKLLRWFSAHGTNKLPLKYENKIAAQGYSNWVIKMLNLKRYQGNRIQGMAEICWLLVGKQNYAVGNRKHLK